MEENTKMQIGDRMKQYENEFNYKILPNEGFIIRLDGRSFSRFTKSFSKPFDINFVKAMSMTMRDLVEKFEAQTGYTHSDEITLIFNSINDDELEIKIHIFDGRIQKLLSLTSAYCSVRFNYHLEKIIDSSDFKYNDNLIKVIKSHQQMFDARILKFSKDKMYEILNHQIWRSVHDCNRNAIQTYTYTNYSTKEVMNKNTTEMIEMLKTKNINWNDIPTFIKHGIYCKKILVDKAIGEPSNENKVLRSEYVFKQFKINFSTDNLNMLLNKYWDNLDNKIILEELKC